MTYTYYTKDARKTKDALSRASVHPVSKLFHRQPWESDRYGGCVCGMVVFDRPLTNEQMIEHALTGGRVPEAVAICEALECGAIYPAFHDGLLCLCMNKEEAKGAEIACLSLPGNLRRISQFWENGPAGAARMVRSMLCDYLPDDDLAGRVLDFIRAIGRHADPADPHKRALTARMAEAATCPELAALAY